MGGLYKSVLALVLLCLVCGFALMVPPLRRTFNRALPMHSFRGKVAHENVDPNPRSMKDVFMENGTDVVATTTIGLISVFPPTSSGCKKVCMFQGRSESCGRRIQVAATNTFRGRSDSCAEAWAQVRSECLGVCGSCNIADAGCESISS